MTVAEPTKLQTKRLDLLAEQIRKLPADRQALLMTKLEEQATFDLDEAAELLAVTKRWLQMVIERGDLRAAKMGHRTIRISRTELARYFAEKGGGQLFDDLDPAELNNNEATDGGSQSTEDEST